MPASRDVFDLRESVLHLLRNGSSEVVGPPSGPHERIDGYEIGAPFMTRSAPLTPGPGGRHRPPEPAA